MLSSALAAGILAAAPRALRAASLDASERLTVPANGKIRVAFMLSPGANVMDLAGPWEVFQDVRLPNGDRPFELSTIAESISIVEMTGGMRIEPTHAFGALHPPNVVVVGAQGGYTDSFTTMLRELRGKADLIMSVCTGAFQLGHAGILDGKSATTHHEYYDSFAKEFPNVRLVRGQRYVDSGNIITAGGLTSGIESALHVVARHFDAQTAARTAAYLEFSPTPRES